MSMYTRINFKTKKAVKEAVASGRHVEVFQPGPFPGLSTGRVTLEGPHYPEPHKWYASATIENNVIIKVT